MLLYRQRETNIDKQNVTKKILWINTVGNFSFIHKQKEIDYRQLKIDENSNMVKVINGSRIYLSVVIYTII